MAKPVKCVFCHKEFITKEEAKQCEQEHRNQEEIIYVPLLKTDLAILAHYIMSGEKKLLTERVSDSILRYLRK